LTGPLVNGRFLTRRPTGVDRFAREIVRCLANDTTPGEPVQALVPAGTAIDPASAIEGVETLPTGRFGGHLWEQTALARYRPDRTLLCLCNTGPVTRANQLVVIHDAAVFATPQNYSLAFRTLYRALLPRLVRRARVVATVSRFSAQELARYLDWPVGRFEIVGESGEHILRYPADTSVLDRMGLRSRTYVLTVGSQARNKNLRTVLAAMQLLERDDVVLVAVGGSDRRVFSSRSDETPAANKAARFTGFVTDAELRALYENAACFVFASLYEGFGLPPVEAMTCGCPVVVSNRASLPEVCGEAAVYVDPEDVGDVARRVADVLGAHTRQTELALAGRARANVLRWHDAADTVERLAR
jgi:glycosyltransferase involved in cell wall biosynthesis